MERFFGSLFYRVVYYVYGGNAPQIKHMNDDCSAKECVAFVRADNAEDAIKITKQESSVEGSERFECVSVVKSNADMFVC